MEENYLGMEKIGLSKVRDVYRNLPVEVLVDHIVDNQEGRIGLRGAAMVDTGTVSYTHLTLPTNREV